MISALRILALGAAMTLLSCGAADQRSQAALLTEEMLAARSFTAPVTIAAQKEESR